MKNSIENSHSDKITIIYVVGSGHCGSTLLDIIMDSHSKIVGVGELTNWSFNKKRQLETICSCKKTLMECSFWQKVFKNIPDEFQLSDSKLEIHQKKLDFIFNRKRYFSSVNRAKKIDFEKYLRLNEQIYKNILAVSGKKVIFDSSKDVDRANILSYSDKLELIFLHLVRDGRGVSYSYKIKYSGIISPVFRWALKNLKIEIFKRRYRERFVFIRYEDFCKDPKKEIEKILKKVGLDFEPQMLNFSKKIHHQAGGNRLRFDEVQEIKENILWRKRLPVFDKIVFHILFGWLNKIYNY